MSKLEEIRAKLGAMGAEPKRSLGQNFLVSTPVIERILAAAEKPIENHLIEVGPGLGALSESLLSWQRPLQLIELDKKFAEYWRGQGAKVVEGDALKQDWQELIGEHNTTLVSNLPYQIGGALVIELSKGPSQLQKMVLMFQKEVAQRLQAQPKTEDYGLLTVVAQSFWRINKVTDAGMRDFYPAPKVNSRVLQFERLDQDLPAEKFISFVKQCFSQRRKLLTKNISGWRGVSKELLGDHLTELFGSSKLRAEELSPEDFHRLFRALT